MVEFGFVILDVDDVVVDMDALAAAAQNACLAPLVSELGENVGAAVHADFVRAYADLRRQLRASPGEAHPSYAPLRAAIDRWQAAVVAAGHEVKPWSRQTLLAVALEQQGVPVSGTLIHHVVDEVYWGTIRIQSRPTPDATAAINALRATGVPFHLATNSDGFLLFDDVTATFQYDPIHAVEEKRRRLQCLSTIGIEPSDITVGDPIGKPDRRFYDGVLADFEAKLETPIDLSRTLVVGDSLSNDVEPLLLMGAARGAWLLKERPLGAPAWLDGPEPLDRVIQVQRLSQLAEVDWGLSR